jgi:fumarylacetoacetase
MTYEINETHDPNLRSWVESANDPNSDFPIQNLPFCTFEKSRRDVLPVIGVRIGDQLLDLVELWHDGQLEAGDPSPFDRPFAALNDVLRTEPLQNSNFRAHLSSLLAENAEKKETISKYLTPAAKALIAVPAYIGDYTDFYCSIYHATNVGSMFRPDNPLMPNYKYVPIGYHGRASSIVVSGGRTGRTAATRKSRRSSGRARISITRWSWVFLSARETRWAGRYR